MDPVFSHIQSTYKKIFVPQCELNGSSLSLSRKIEDFQFMSRK